MCLAAFFVLALLLSVWRSFRFSLPLPDFPFKLNGSRAPSCTLQRLLNAARFACLSPFKWQRSPHYCTLSSQH